MLDPDPRVAAIESDPKRYRVAQVVNLTGAGRPAPTAVGTRCHTAVGTRSVRKGPGGKTLPLTNEERRRFLRALAEHGNVAYAAEHGGRSRACFYHHRKQDDSFAHAWAQARAGAGGRINRPTIKQRQRAEARAGAAAAGGLS